MKNKFKLSNETVEGLHRRPLYNELIGMLDTINIQIEKQHN